MNAQILTIERLRVGFQQYEHGLRRRVVPAIRDVSLSVSAGEVLAVVGASGAGKSLIGLATLGLLPPNAEEGGTVSFRGQPVAPAERRRLAGSQITLLPQSVDFLDPLARVGRQLERAATLAGVPDPGAAARRALRRRGLPETTLRLYPHQCSGGMARRVLVAMASLARPQLVFADEPTPGLHSASAATVLQDLRRLADDGVAVIVVSHDLDSVLPISDRVVVCAEGRSLEEALPEQFRGDGAGLRSAYARQLWRALPAHGFRLDPESAR